jgi:hypothetical protein
MLLSLSVLILCGAFNQVQGQDSSHTCNYCDIDSNGLLHGYCANGEPGNIHSWSLLRLDECYALDADGVLKAPGQAGFPQ